MNFPSLWTSGGEGAPEKIKKGEAYDTGKRKKTADTNDTKLNRGRKRTLLYIPMRKREKDRQV